MSADGPTSGGAFLLGPTAPECIQTPEDLPEDTRLMADTMDRFVRSEVLPHLPALEARQEGLLRRLMTRAGDLGLLAGGIPTTYSGLGLTRAALCLLYERAALCPSFALTHNVHSGVATLPLIWFGTDEQKARYLPTLARGERIGAFALTEANSGSDALAARCRAIPTQDGGYRLTGVKNWITNAGLADLFVVFARIEGDSGGLTAFLVERNTAGVTLGREEEKMGLRGASTRALVLDNVPVPASAVLGEVGRGHRVALQPLNIGRLNIGAGALGAAKDALRAAARHARHRRQFNRPLASLGLIREKLGTMAARAFAAEAMVYRVAGLLDAALLPASAAEYAAECALVKIYATEALDYIVDEALQIHGGYGFSEAYPVARAYRDARVSRIFEGTNEINRLTVVDQLGKRISSPGRASASRGEDARSLAYHSLLALWERQPNPTDTAQECAAACADLCLALFSAESAALRAVRLADTRNAALADAAAAVILDDACDTARRAVRTLCTHLDDHALWARLSALLPEPWTDTVAARRLLADACTDAEDYPF